MWRVRIKWLLGSNILIFQKVTTTRKYQMCHTHMRELYFSKLIRNTTIDSLNAINMGSAFRVGNALRSIIMNVAINVKNLSLRHFFVCKEWKSIQCVRNDDCWNQRIFKLDFQLVSSKDDEARKMRSIKISLLRWVGSSG